MDRRDEILNLVNRHDRLIHSGSKCTLKILETLMNGLKQDVDNLGVTIDEISQLDIDPVCKQKFIMHVL